MDMGSMTREKIHTPEQIDQSVSAVQVVVTHLYIEKPDIIHKLTRGRMGKTNFEVETVRRNLNEVLAIFRQEQETYRKTLSGLTPVMEKIHTALGAIIFDYNAHIEESVANHNRTFGTRISCKEGKINLGNIIDIYSHFNHLEKEFHAMEMLRDTITSLLSGINPEPMAVRYLRSVPAHVEDLHKALAHLSHVKADDMPDTRLEKRAAAIVDMEGIIRRELLPQLNEHAKSYMHLLAYADHASFLRRELVKTHNAD